MKKPYIKPEIEIWKVYHNGPKVIWEISDQGRVKKNRELYECRLDKNGYKVFGSGWAVHRAVVELFIPNPENKPQVDHINGNKLDNQACNLRRATAKENSNNPITLKRRSEAQKIAQNKPETRKRQSESHKGKKLGPQSEETRRKKSESMKGKNNPMYGKSHTEEAKRKNSEWHKSKYKRENNPMYGVKRYRVYHDDGTYHYEKQL